MRDAADLFPKYGHYQEARRHALKLAWWPGGDDRSGKVEDLDWEWIDGMGDPRAGELRIHDEIGGYDNLRVIFWPAPTALAGDPQDRHGRAMKRIWTLSVLQKKTQRFEKRDLTIFKARLVIVRSRYYGR